MTDLSRDELLYVLESALEAQLKAVRALRREPVRPKERRSARGRSNIGVVADVLAAAQGPLHVAEIIERAQTLFGRKLSRESLVSALTKKCLDEQVFRRIAPNTFDLLRRGEE